MKGSNFSWFLSTRKCRLGWDEADSRQLFWGSWMEGSIGFDLWGWTKLRARHPLDLAYRQLSSYTFLFVIKGSKHILNLIVILTEECSYSTPTPARSKEPPFPANGDYHRKPQRSTLQRSMHHGKPRPNVTSTSKLLHLQIRGHWQRVEKELDYQDPLGKVSPGNGCIN